MCMIEKDELMWEMFEQREWRLVNQEDWDKYHIPAIFIFFWWQHEGARCPLPADVDKSTAHATYSAPLLSFWQITGWLAVCLFFVSQSWLIVAIICGTGWERSSCLKWILMNSSLSLSFSFSVALYFTCQLSSTAATMWNQTLGPKQNLFLRLHRHLLLLFLLLLSSIINN